MWVARHWQDTRITLRFLIWGDGVKMRLGHEHVDLVSRSHLGGDVCFNENWKYRVGVQ